MKKTKSRGKKPVRPPAPHDEASPPAGGKRPDKTRADDVHDAAHPGGLPDLEAKTETEAEHDSWGRHG